MLLKQCITELKISQKSVAEGIGWSRTAVNLFLNQGRIPVDAERFRAGVRRFVEQNPQIDTWLTENGTHIEALFVPPAACVDLEEVIIDLVGFAALYGPRTDTLNRFARMSQYLLECLRAVNDTAEIETEAARLLGMRGN
ncbi:MAG TPA: hypothetical protein HPP94_08750 [Desulfuromonadales bacterium]|nr:hypothetical protein [Desulfuromonadales bacterium]